MTGKSLGWCLRAALRSGELPEERIHEVSAVGRVNLNTTPRFLEFQSPIYTTSFGTGEAQRLVD